MLKLTEYCFIDGMRVIFADNKRQHIYLRSGDMFTPACKEYMVKNKIVKISYPRWLKLIGMGKKTLSNS